MAKLVPNTFSLYQLTEEEETNGTILNTNHKAVIQNSIAFFAEQKLALIFNPNDPQDFGIQTAFLAGKIEALQHLLINSDEMETTVAQLAIQNKE